MSKALLLLGVVLFLSAPLAASGSSSLSAGSGSELMAAPPGSSIDGLLEELLRRYDTNGDGKLDPAERHRMLWDIFKDQDPSQPTNVIDEQDFIDWLLSMGYNLNTARNLWLQLLQEADTNGDGVISIKEFTDFLRRHGLVQSFVLVPVDPEEIEPGTVYPVDLMPGHGSHYDSSDFLLLVSPKDPAQK